MEYNKMHLPQSKCGFIILTGTFIIFHSTKTLYSSTDIKLNMRLNMQERGKKIQQASLTPEPNDYKRSIKHINYQTREQRGKKIESI